MVMGSKGKKLEEGGGRSVGLPAPFLTKTYQMVEDGETEDVISWGEKGVSFVVWKPVEFARDLLPVHFKHNNFSSFVRQLNTYGFRKVVADRWEFANDNFRRGEQTLLSFIRRRKSSSNRQPPRSSNSGQHSAEIHSSSSASSPPPPSPQLLNLSSENEKLRRENKILNTELAQAKRHCDELLGFLSKYVDVGQLDLGLLRNRSVELDEGEEVVSEEAEEEDEAEKETSLKLFGVVLKVNVSCDEVQRSTKRRRCQGGGGGRMPVVRASWADVSSPVGGSSNVSQRS
ncbi:hypothetical protein IEQ34_015394 [Dendrobium chrysotoxum]|uniref:HSF-type DNA-binding domain-containing protein n=1 Tax=Dendrobium chrysotoxum TaxID=161865 RepID=A0AAV7GHH3_DENCH|nr:hypothetical protein IEQ34_015394 [Dendrobium chrysotoxum]